MDDNDIKRLLAEATPGPWELRFPNRVSVPREPDEDNEDDFTSICKGRQENCNLIAAAPALAAEALRRGEEIARLRGLVGRLVQQAETTALVERLRDLFVESAKTDRCYDPACDSPDCIAVRDADAWLAARRKGER